MNPLVLTRSLHLLELYHLNMYLVYNWISVCCNIIYTLFVKVLPTRSFPPSVRKWANLAIFTVCLRKLHMRDTSCLLELKLDHFCQNSPPVHTGSIDAVMVVKLTWDLSWKRINQYQSKLCLEWSNPLKVLSRMLHLYLGKDRI